MLNQNPLIISGPSGIGKSYLERYLCEHHNFARIISTTIRPKRENEIHQKDYHFLTKQEYKLIESQQGFITSVYNLNAWYGFEKSLVESIQTQGKIPITICIPQIIDKFIQHYPNTNAIYLISENSDLLQKRMKMRGDSPDKITTRMEYAEKEFIEYQNKKELYTQEFLIKEDNFISVVNNILKLYF